MITVLSFVSSFTTVSVFDLLVHNNYLKKKKKVRIYLATCSRTPTFFFQESSSNPPLACNGGNENTLTVELPLRISFNTLNADTVLFIYKLSMYSISDRSFGTRRRSVPEVVASPSPSSSSRFRLLLDGKRRSSIASHSFTNVLSRSVVKNGSCRTF